MTSIFVVTFISTDDIGSGGALKAFHGQPDALNFAREAAQETLDSLKGVGTEGVEIDHNEDGSFFEAGDDAYWFTVDRIDLI